MTLRAPKRSPPETDSIPKNTMSTEQPKLTLYSYFRSSCSWRVRIALAQKNLAYDYVAVPLLQKKQSSAEYSALNPMQQVPTLAVEDPTTGQKEYLSQSLAIIAYLDSLVPPAKTESPLQTAYIHALAQDIATGIQPIQNLNILLHVKELTGGDDAKKTEWAQKYITAGLHAIEQKLTTKPLPLPESINDINVFHMCLIPQLYNARRFNIDTAQFPILLAIEKACESLPPFTAAHPDAQPDAGQI